MNTKEIEVLIEKYFEGLTSIEEERLLKDFFASGDFPDEMKPVQPCLAILKLRRKLNSARIFLMNLSVKSTKSG